MGVPEPVAMRTSATRPGTTPSSTTYCTALAPGGSVDRRGGSIAAALRASASARSPRASAAGSSRTSEPSSRTAPKDGAGAGRGEPLTTDAIPTAGGGPAGGVSRSSADSSAFTAGSLPRRSSVAPTPLAAVPTK